MSTASVPLDGRDTAGFTQTTELTRKRPGHTLPAGFTGGNLEGVCVPTAFWRLKPHFGDQRNDEERKIPCSI
jgi:hypothetical protein